MTQSSDQPAFPKRSGFATALLLAMTAGFAALVIQLIAIRIAVAQFGISSTTISVMIAMALVGLSLGAMFLGKIADKTANPLRLLGMVFLLSSFLCAFLAGFEIEIGKRISIAPITVDLQRAVFAAVTMFPVNFLLGGTLPILVRGVGDLSEAKNFRFGLLYGSETIGAAAGSIVAGFWSIQSIGLQNSMLVSTGLLAVAGLAAIFKGRDVVLIEEAGALSDSDSIVSASPLVKGLLLLAVVFAGGATMGMEVIWQRIFAILFGSDVQSYSIVVACFLVGISLGAVLSRNVVRHSCDPIELYGILSIAIGLVAICSTEILSGFLSDNAVIWSNPFSRQWPVLARIVAATVLLIVPTTLIGLAFPMAAYVWIGDPKLAAGKTGQIYGAALIGNVVGILLSGYWLIPSFGLSGSMFALTCVLTITGSGIFFIRWCDSKVGSPVSRLAAPGFVGVLLIGWGCFSYYLLSNSAPLGIFPGHFWQVEFYQEGPVNTVATIRDTRNPDSRKMVVDGVVIGESEGGVAEKQQMLSHLPFLLRSECSEQEVLTIGLGTGILAGAIADNPCVSKVTCLELSPAVIRASEKFSDLNGNVLSRDSVEVVLGDGLQFLHKHKGGLDVIVSDAKSRPGHGGNVGFFSVEYYKLCNSKLGSDGLFIQWLPLETSNPALRIILNTFAAAFEYGHVGVAAPDSLYLVGTRQPLQIEKQHIESYLSESCSDELSKYDWSSYDDVISMYWIDQQTVAGFFRGACAINQFDRPILERYSLETFRHAANSIRKENLTLVLDLLKFDMSRDVDDTRFNSNALQSAKSLDLQRELGNGRLAAQEIVKAAILVAEQKKDWLDASARHMKDAIQLLPGLSRQSYIAEFYRQIATQAKEETKTSKEFSALLNISELQSASADDEIRLGEILCQFGEHEKALNHYYRATRLQPESTGCRTEFAFLLLNLNKLSQAARQFETVLEADPEHAFANLGFGITLAREEKDAESQMHLRRAIQIDPSLVRKFSQYGIAVPD